MPLPTLSSVFSSLPGSGLLPSSSEEDFPQPDGAFHSILNSPLSYETNVGSVVVSEHKRDRLTDCGLGSDDVVGYEDPCRMRDSPLEVWDAVQMA